MKVWIIKSLTEGIIEADAESCGGNIASVSWDNGTRCMNLYWDECYLSKEFAIKKAEEMRQDKIKSLQKKIKELEELRFEL